MQHLKGDKTKKFRCTSDLIDAINILVNQSTRTKTSESDIIHRAVGQYLRTHFRQYRSDVLFTEIMDLCNRLENS